MLFNFLVLAVLVVYSHEASMSKVNKITPSITNSFVNLGKVDIAFHVHRNEEIQSTAPKRSASSSRHNAGGQDSCPCSGRSNKNPYSQMFNPSNFLKKMFSSVDPLMSAACCDSHELIQDTFIVDLDPVQMQSFLRQIRPSVPLRPDIRPLPYTMGNLFPLEKPVALPKMPTKSKSIDFFFLPPNKDFKELSPVENKVSKKDLILAVGDKDKDFKNLKYPYSHMNSKASVKKDLQDKAPEDIPKLTNETEVPMEMTTVKPINVSIGNVI